jgi:hypothetical protein
MTTLVLQPFALREGRLSCGLSLEEIHETLRHAHGMVLAVSGSRVNMRWGPAMALDYPDPTFGGSVPATDDSKMSVKAKLRRHEYLGRVLPQGPIRLFFVWDFASHLEGGKTVQPKGLTIDSHNLMVVGAKASLRERSNSTAHEIGHALLGSDASVHRNDDRGNLMFGDTGGVGAKLDDGQRDFFVRNAARVAVGTNILRSEFQYVKGGKPI